MKSPFRYLFWIVRRFQMSEPSFVRYARKNGLRGWFGEFVGGRRWESEFSWSDGQNQWLKRKSLSRGLTLYVYFMNLCPRYFWVSLAENRPSRNLHECVNETYQVDDKIDYKPRTHHWGFPAKLDVSSWYTDLIRKGKSKDSETDQYGEVPFLDIFVSGKYYPSHRSDDGLSGDFWHSHVCGHYHNIRDPTGCHQRRRYNDQICCKASGFFTSCPIHEAQSIHVTWGVFHFYILKE